MPPAGFASLDILPGLHPDAMLVRVSAHRICQGCLPMHPGATACRAAAMHPDMGSSDGSLAISQIADLDRRNAALHTELAGARQELLSVRAQLQGALQELDQLREVGTCLVVHCAC